MDALIKERDALQTRLNVIFQYFHEHNITHSTSLLDAQGFPRADLDLVTVTNYRAELSRLQNDLKGINDQLSDAVLQHHSKFSQPSQPSSNPPTHLKPWSIVDNILSNSPSHAAGLAVGDKIVKLGPFTSATHNNFEQLPGFVRSNGLLPIEVEAVSSDGSKRTLTVQPNGASIGMHIQPL